MFMRLLGDEEKGLLYSDVRHVRRRGFDRTVEQVDGYRVPLELPIHGELYKARPDAQVRAPRHPYHCLVATIAGLELRPIYGSYDPLSLGAAIQGIPVYPRSVLIDSPELAADFMAVMATGTAVSCAGTASRSSNPTVKP